MIDPIDRFGQLFERARRASIDEPTAMALATVSPDGCPSVRMVLLKDFDRRGFVFYTNMESRKGEELLANPNAALCFHWQPLQTQVRIEGRVSEVSPEEADAYFESRPRGSQIGAWASLQSRPLAAFAELEEKVAEITRRFEGRPVERPPHWSGFRVRPERMEFWSGRPSRLHEREVYTRNAEGGWTLQLLYP